ncbi:MAG: TonB-dependent receptor plug domain-containing protein [Roseateles sp.]|uniref:TonB-dependent receptor plug domain-containing protein n=1 Tax=Roseateles sp. TaxID=1971397 RepID=UPI004035F16D
MSQISLAARRPLLALSALAFAASTHAQNRLDTVVTTATRAPQKLSDVLSDMTVLTRADIERQAFGSLADLLRRQVGFEMIRNGGAGANTSMFVRGADTRHTAVLIDGVRIDSQASSGASWSAIPMAQVERVEIVRGAASALYGSDAIGGVVQIFTRKGEGKPVIDFGIGGGNRGLAKVDASISGRSGIIDYALAAAGESSNGFNARPAAATATFTPDDDGYQSRNASLRLGVQLAAGHRLEASALTSHVNSEYDSTATARTDDRTLSDTRATRLAWAAQWTGALRSELSVGESSERYETQPSPYVTKTRVRTYGFNTSWNLGAAGTLQGLLERREDQLDNTGLIAAARPGHGERHQDAIGAGWTWAANALSVQLNVRHDRDSEFGGVDTGSLAGGYRLGGAWRVQASAGTSFRAPSLYQRFSDSGKATLRPEQARNAELGLHYAAGRDEFSLTAYRNLVRDLIVYVSTPVPAPVPARCPSPFGCYDNVSQGRLQGLSLRGATALGPVRLSGTLDLQAPKDVDKASANYGKLLARRAKTHGSVRAETDVGAWTLGAQLLASSKRTDNLSTRYQLGGYALLDVDAQVALSSQLSLQFKVDNLLDRQYQTARSYAATPRQVFIGLRVTPQF